MNRFEQTQFDSLILLKNKLVSFSFKAVLHSPSSQTVLFIMKLILVVFASIAVSTTAYDGTAPIPPPGGIFPNTDHSEVQKILIENLKLLKNENGLPETGLT